MKLDKSCPCWARIMKEGTRRALFVSHIAFTFLGAIDFSDRPHQ